MLMLIWIDYLRAYLHSHLGNEEGQSILVWLVVLFVLWLVLSGRRVVVQ